MSSKTNTSPAIAGGEGGGNKQTIITLQALVSVSPPFQH